MPTLPVMTLSAGMQIRTSKYLVRQNELIMAKNTHGDMIGAWTKRLGYAKTGNTVGSDAIQGLFGFEQVDGTDKHLAVTGTSLKFNSSGTWSTIGGTSFPSSARVEFTSFLDRAYIVGANTSGSYLTTGTLNGTTYAETAFPGAKFAIIYFDKLHLVNTTNGTSRVDYSSIPTTAGVITFTQATDFLQVQTEDGDELTGVAKSYGQLLLFKNFSLHTWNLSRLEQIDDKGTSSFRSIQNFGNNVLYLHRSPTTVAVCLWDGQASRQISRPVEPFLQGMTAANAIIAPSGRKSNHYYLYIGDVTLSTTVANYYGISTTQSNILLDYSFSDNAWAVHSLPVDVTVMSSYNNELYFGDSTGLVYQWASGNSDNGTAISAEVITHEYYPVSPSNRKNFDGVRIFMNTPHKARAYASVDGGAWISLGICQEKVNYFNLNKKGFGIRIKITQSGSDGAFVFDGLEIDYKDEGKLLK